MGEAPKMQYLLSAAQMRTLGMAVPAVLVSIENALGADAMRRLVSGAGGRKVFIPSRATVSNSVIAQRCGPDVAECLSEMLGPGIFQVPLGPAALRPRVVVAVLTGLAAGETGAQMAARTGRHERTITRIIADLRRNGAALASVTKELSS